MKITRQLLRQPLKTLAGVLMVTLAVAIVCVCVSQSLAALGTKETIDRRLITVALRTKEYGARTTMVDGRATKILYPVMSMERLSFLEDMRAAHPEVIKTISNPGLASAYIPELAPDNLSQYLYHGDNELETSPTYACGMFEILVTEIGEPRTIVAKGKAEDGTEIALPRYVTADIGGTIERVLALEDGYDDPTGRIASITLVLPVGQELEDLEVGGRYLVYTNDYQDGEWLLKSAIVESLYNDMLYNDLPEELLDWRKIDTDDINFKSAVPFYQYEYTIVELSKTHLRWKDAAVMTVQDLSDFGIIRWETHENGSLPTMDHTRYVTDESGNQVQISEEQWQQRYSIPTMARLEGTAEEFLASEEGALWRQYLAYTEVNYHAFPIIGVDQLGYIGEFARENAKITQGRDFTQEELAEGSKVCILSEFVAAANGLSVGDTICPRFYNYDWSDPNQGYLSDYEGLVNPWAYRYTPNTAFAGEAEEYTIVGLYRQDNPWADPSENPQAFTPNTIFVPGRSVPSDMDRSSWGVFQTVVLQNGSIPAFRAQLMDAGFSDSYVYSDQGYTIINDTLTDYLEVARQAVAVGLAVYGVVLLLYLLLFPGSQGRTLTTMTALGAKRSQKLRQIILSSAGILLPGSLVGLGAGILLWDKLVAWLAEGAGSTLTLEMDPWVLAAVALAQLALALVLTALLALPMSGSKDMKGRR